MNELARATADDSVAVHGNHFQYSDEVWPNTRKAHSLCIFLFIKRCGFYQFFMFWNTQIFRQNDKNLQTLLSRSLLQHPVSTPSEYTKRIERVRELSALRRPVR